MIVTTSKSFLFLPRWGWRSLTLGRGNAAARLCFLSFLLSFFLSFLFLPVHSRNNSGRNNLGTNSKTAQTGRGKTQVKTNYPRYEILKFFPHPLAKSIKLNNNSKLRNANCITLNCKCIGKIKYNGIMI